MSKAWWHKWATDYNKAHGTAYVLEEKMDDDVIICDHCGEEMADDYVYDGEDEHRIAVCDNPDCPRSN